jgi:hypothetical protein
LHETGLFCQAEHSTAALHHDQRISNTDQTIVRVFLLSRLLLHDKTILA